MKALWGSISDSSEDSKLTTLLKAVSGQVEANCGRNFLYVTGRTATLDIAEHSRYFFLKAFPAVANVVVKYDPAQVFGSDTIIDNTGKGRYVVDAMIGAVVFHTPWGLERAQALRVEYDGGFDATGTTGDLLATAAEDVALAVALQVVWDWKRVRMPGYSSVSIQGQSGSTDVGQEVRGLLPEVYDLLRPYSSRVERR